MKYLKKSLCILLFTTGFTNIAVADSKAEMKNVGNNLAFFYKQPSKQSFERIQKGITKYQDEIPKHNLIQPIIWANVVAKKYSWKIRRDFFPKKVALLNNDQSRLAQFIANDKQITPEKLDIWWASFFATGESRYVRNVFNQAVLFAQTKNIDLTQAAAVWSFKSNCKQHEKIRDFAKNWSTESHLNQNEKKLLLECIK